ncbi:MAG: hypothetical protein SNH99_01830 [Rikenellaceae bacterium]
MRLAADVKCSKCGYTWYYITGIGFNEASYHCNKCGKERIVPLAYGEAVRVSFRSKGGACECGGAFVMNNDSIICPKCHNHISNDILEEILWD